MVDRSQLWNAAELFEKRSNSRTAREFDIALPTELTHPQKQELVRKFVQDNFVDKGLVADIAFHEIDTHNPHVHIMITTRTVDENGLGAKDRSLVTFLETIAEKLENLENQLNKNDQLHHQKLNQVQGSLSHKINALNENYHLIWKAAQYEKQEIKTHLDNVIMFRPLTGS